MKQMTRDILSDAHDLIEDEENWDPLHIACTEAGVPCMSYLPEAARYSALGAISFAGDKRGADNQDKYAAIEAFVRVAGDRIVPYNAAHTHQQVLAVFQAAMVLP